MINAKNIKPVTNNGLDGSFRGYTTLLCQIKQRVLLVQQRAISATKKCSECIGMSEVCCDKANKLMAGTEDTTTLIFGLEKRLSRNKSIHRTQYAVYGAVF